MKKGQWDNDYRFYDDGTIEHEYDTSVKKYNLVSKISPSDIDERDRVAILAKIDECPEEWRTFVRNLLQ
jgi:hypothetical protein